MSRVVKNNFYFIKRYIIVDVNYVGIENGELCCVRLFIKFIRFVMFKRWKYVI